MTDLPKFHPNERVDLGDVEFISQSHFDEFQRVGDTFLLGAGARIIDGFTRTLVPANVIRINLGKAYVAENRLSVTRAGQLLSEGVVSQDVSFLGLSVATHGIWIRYTLTDGVQANRIFWDTVAAEEKVRSVTTRKVSGWSALVSQTSPGPEWVKLYDVAWDGASVATSTITDRRPFFFEGPADSSPQTFRSTWGGGNDRNADRATYGVKTLERFVAAMTKKVEELQSSTAAVRWWTAPAEALDRKVSRFGDLALTGDYQLTGGSFAIDRDEGGLRELIQFTTGGADRFKFQANYSAGGATDDFIRLVGHDGTNTNTLDLIKTDGRRQMGLGTTTLDGSTFAGLLTLSHPGSAASPTPTTAGLVVRGRDSVASRSSAILLDNAGADAGFDGIFLWSQRTAEDVPELTVGTEKDAAYAHDILKLRYVGGVSAFADFELVPPVASTTIGLALGTASARVKGLYATHIDLSEIPGLPGPGNVGGNLVPLTQTGQALGEGGLLPFRWNLFGEVIDLKAPAGDTASTGRTNKVVSRSLIKAWANVFVEGTAGDPTTTFQDGFNCTVTDNGLTGSSHRLVVAFTDFMANANYAVLVSTSADDDSNDIREYRLQRLGKSGSGFSLELHDGFGADAPTTPANNQQYLVSVLVLGIQT